MYLLPYAPDIPRHELAHGQGTQSYAERNALVTENVTGQAAPDPIRQSNAAHRPSRRFIAVMANPATWDLGFANRFIPYGHLLTRQANRQFGSLPQGRSQQPVGIRPNLDRPAAVAYGSLFTLATDTYDYVS